jgi:hypothetical protein
VELSNNVYPNPFRNMLNVRFNGGMNQPIKILDSMQRIVFESDPKGETTLDTSDWSSGFYFLVTEKAVSKLIKK